MFPFWQIPYSFCLYYSKFLFVPNCWNERKYTYWTIILLSGPLTSQNPLKIKTKPKYNGKKVFNPQLVALTYLKDFFFNQYPKKTNFGQLLGVHYKGLIPYKPRQIRRKNRQEMCHTSSEMQQVKQFIYTTFFLPWQLTIAIMSKRRRVFSQNGLSLATLSSIWHKSRNMVLTILTQVLNRVLRWETPIQNIQYNNS